MPSSVGDQRSATEEVTRRCGPYTVRLTHLDKVLYKQAGVSKREVVDYYERIASLMLPQLRDRPLVMERYPDGTHEEGFFQRAMPDYFPEWFQQAAVTARGRRQYVPVCNNKASLLYLANQGSLTLHSWLSRRGSADKPDQLIFDLDPPAEDFEPVRQAALAIIALLDELGLASYTKTTGSRGLHVMVPILRQYGFDQARAFARDCARLLVSRTPESYTLEQRIADRGGRLYLDVQRNSYGQTAVAPYSLRARAGAPIAAPISRKQLQDPELHAAYYSIKNIFSSTAQRSDPWCNHRKHARSLKGPASRLQKLLDEAIR